MRFPHSLIALSLRRQTLSHALRIAERLDLRAGHRAVFMHINCFEVLSDVARFSRARFRSGQHTVLVAVGRAELAARRGGCDARRQSHDSRQRE